MDRKPPCEPEHSPVGGDGPTLGEVLGVNEASPSPAAAQRQMEEAIYAVVSPATGDETCLVFFDNTEEQIAELLRVCTGRLLGNERVGCASTRKTSAVAPRSCCRTIPLTASQS